jgi:energy-coupling factor transporter ATP-binding protein EcfA2
MPTLLYNPDRKSKTELISEFVIRTDIYEDIMNDLKTSRMKSAEQHYLLVGQRGAGKSTLLNRIKYGVEDAEVLKGHLIPILFTEEQYNVSELVNLWESVAQQLEDYHGFGGLYEEIEKIAGEDGSEERCFEILEKALVAKRKKLLLLIDNVGDILKKLEEIEVRRLREILQTSPEIRLIVASPFYLEAMLDYHQPFFEFFKVLRLDGLNEEETQQLLLKLAEVNNEKERIESIVTNTPQRVETLRQLTGGVPRTIALMFNVFVEFNSESAVKDLERILDAVTPLYKHRMDDLPAQQQKIVDAVARNWDGISVKELRERLRIDNKVISAQLRQLFKDQVIEIVDSGNKNHIYFIKERFFNIWYLMRYGRKYDRQRVVWLVKFLESWCTTRELEERILDYVKKVEAGKINGALVDFYAETYSSISGISIEMKTMLKEGVPDYLSGRIELSTAEVLTGVVRNFEERKYGEAWRLVKYLREFDDKTTAQIVTGLLSGMSDNDQSMIDAKNKLFERLEGLGEPIKLGITDYLFVVALLASECVYNISNGDYEKVENILNGIINLIIHETTVSELAMNILIEVILLQLLGFKMTSLAIKLFEDYPILKDRVLPFYYVTLKLTGRDGEFKKIPPEIRRTVEDIRNRISQMQKEISKD